MNRYIVTIAAVAILLISVSVGAVAMVNRYLDSPLNIDGDALVYEVRPGMAFATVAADLADRGILERPDWLRWYGRFTGQAQAVKAGEYSIIEGTTARELLSQFVSGDVRLYAFTIVEGWNIRELIAAMARDNQIVSTLSADDPSQLLIAIGEEAGHPEGLFLPETYLFPKGTTDVALLTQARDLMKTTLEAEWSGRAVGLPLADPYEALVLASIIEKETAKADERARISGVFTRRLQKNMRLQTDPTVIYGVGASFDGNLTRRHLRTDTPYNTYTRHGLPPTPIAMPGQAAINAALNPLDGTELYFVATGLGDGSHEFSDTKDEHDLAVQRYLARQRAARMTDKGGQ